MRVEPLVRVETPRLLRRVARWLGLGLLFVLLACLALPWQQTAAGTGKVIAFDPQERAQTVGAPISGVVQAWLVQEGEPVTAGQVLARMADNAPLKLERLREGRDAAITGIAAAEAAARALDGQIAALLEARRLSLEAADAGIRAAEQKVSAARTERKAAQAEARVARLNLKRIEKLQGKGLRSDRDLEVAQGKAAKARTGVLKAGAGIEHARAEMLGKQAARAEKAADADAKIAKARSSLAKLEGDRAKAVAHLAKAEVQVSQQEAQVVVAPRAGVVMRLLVGQGGEQVKAGTPLAVLIPETANQAATLWITGNDAPLIAPGRKVRLQFEGWPAVQFSGWPAVAVGTFGGEVAFVDYAANKNGTFRVVVRPDPAEPQWPNQRFLRQGARANGWVLLNEVTVGFELWRKLNGFPPVASQDAPNGKPGKGAKK
jgi:multidrug resistance efflux pump